MAGNKKLFIFLNDPHVNGLTSKITLEDNIFVSFVICLSFNGLSIEKKTLTMVTENPRCCVLNCALNYYLEQPQLV